VCLAFHDGLAQSTSAQLGARAQGMGYASSCLTDVWSLQNNIAGLAKTPQSTAGFAYHAIPSFKFFNRAGAVFATPIGPGVGGVSVFRLGDDLYNEQTFSLGFANTLGLASLGLKVNYIQFRAEGLATRTALTASFGGIAAFTQHLSFGAHITNINQPVINELTGERIPTRLVAAISYQSDKLIISGEVDKDLEYSPLFRSGMEYRFLKKIAFRTGFNLNPQSGFFGLGFKTGKCQMDYALQFNDALGLSHQATITWQFTRI
jgi:hypothetical protein